MMPSGLDSLHRPKEKLHHKFKRKAFVIRSMADIQDRSASGHELKRVFNATDLVMLGVGCTVGAGIMVLTGVAARDTAGPGVVISYAIAGFAALLSSLCYAEFAADIPVAGGAFNYIGLTFGEFFAWVAACDLILEYTLSAAAIAKGFTAYMASLCGADLQKVRLQFGWVMLDFPAMGSVVVLSLVLMRSTRESAVLNVIMVVIHMVLILFVMCAGFPFSDTANYEPFLPYGAHGVFAGAAVVFFSFIGFDTVATAAEEAIDPGRSLPIGIVGSLGITTVLYVLMCLVITGMQHYEQIDKDAPFSVAFAKVGLGWAGKVVSVGALVGIVTALLGALLGQARIYITLGRQYLLSPWLARVNEKTGTPINASFTTMCTAGLLALLFDIEQLAKMVSIGTLVVFTLVCSGVLFRRYHVRGFGDPIQPLLYRLAMLVVTSVGASASYTAGAHFAAPVTFLGCWVLTTASFHLLPVRYVPQLFHCPFSPWLPSLGVLCCLHLIGSLGWPAYVRWGVWFSVGVAVYLFYGIHNSQYEGKARREHAIGVFHNSADDGFDAALAMGSDDEESRRGGCRYESTELARLHHPEKDAWMGKANATNGVQGVNDEGLGKSGWELAQLNGGRYAELRGSADGEVVGLITSNGQGSGVGEGVQNGVYQGIVEGGADMGEITAAPHFSGGHRQQQQQQQHQLKQQPQLPEGAGAVHHARGLPFSGVGRGHTDRFQIEAQGQDKGPEDSRPQAHDAQLDSGRRDESERTRMLGPGGRSDSSQYSSIRQ